MEWVIDTLRNGNQEYVHYGIVPGSPEGVINTHNYQAMYYDDGSYAGINEIVFNFEPWLDWYLETTGQRLVGGSGPFAPAAASHGGVATPHLVHQMRVVMVATQLLLVYIWSISPCVWKSWDNCPDFPWSSVKFHSSTHLPCSIPHILEVNHVAVSERSIHCLCFKRL